MGWSPPLLWILKGIHNKRGDHPIFPGPKVVVVFRKVGVVPNSPHLWLDVKLCAAPKSLSGVFPRDFPHKDLGAAHNLKSNQQCVHLARGRQQLLHQRPAAGAGFLDLMKIWAIGASTLVNLVDFSLAKSTLI